MITQAWKQRICYEGQNVYFNQDYTTGIQQKRKQVREVIKQLKEKNVNAQSPYLAQLKMFLHTGTKTFITVEEVAHMLKEMGINVKKNSLERIHHVMAQMTKVTRHWGMQREPGITEADLRVLLE